MQTKKRPVLKRCTKCAKRKKPEAFSRNKNTKDGLSIWCKACAKEYKQRPEVRARAKEYQREYKRRYRLQPDEARKLNRPYIEEILMESDEGTFDVPKKTIKLRLAQLSLHRKMEKTRKALTKIVKSQSPY